MPCPTCGDYGFTLPNPNKRPVTCDCPMGRGDKREGRMLHVTPEEYDQLRRADTRAHVGLDRFNEALWLDEVRRILGDSVVNQMQAYQRTILWVTRTVGDRCVGR